MDTDIIDRCVYIDIYVSVHLYLLIYTSICSDATANPDADGASDVSRRCAPDTFDAAEASDCRRPCAMVPYRPCAGPAPWYRTGPAPALRYLSRSAWHAARTARRCRVLAGTSAGTGRVVDGTPRVLAGGRRRRSTGWVLPGTPAVPLDSHGCAAAAARAEGRACGAVVRRCVRVRCRGQQRVPGGLRADRDRGGVPHPPPPPPRARLRRRVSW